MKNLLLVLSLVLSTAVFSQDKEKISTGHEDVISSVIVSVGQCKSNFKDLLRQITQAYDSQRSTIEVTYSLSYTSDKVVRTYDKKKTKKDGEKKEELINVKEVRRNGVVKTKRFNGSIALYKQKYSKKKEAYVTKKRKLEKVILEATATVVTVEEECLNTKDALEQN